MCDSVLLMHYYEHEILWYKHVRIPSSASCTLTPVVSGSRAMSGWGGGGGGGGVEGREREREGERKEEEREGEGRGKEGSGGRGMNEEEEETKISRSWVVELTCRVLLALS